MYSNKVSNFLWSFFDRLIVTNLQAWNGKMTLNFTQSDNFMFLSNHRFDLHPTRRTTILDRMVLQQAVLHNLLRIHSSSIHSISKLYIQFFTEQVFVPSNSFIPVCRRVDRLLFAFVTFFEVLNRIVCWQDVIPRFVYLSIRSIPHKTVSLYC